MQITKLFLIFVATIWLVACTETRTYNSGDYASASSSKNLEISDDEAEGILQRILDRYNNGEDIDSTIKAMLRVLTNQLSSKHSWKGVELSSENQAALRKKQSFYLSQITTALNDYKFFDGCDGLLFSSLAQSAGVEVDIFQAESEKEPGRWYRSATQDCFDSGRSESTISRDMLLGLAITLNNSKELDAVSRLIDYSDDNNRVIGEASDEESQFGRAFMSPSLEAMYHEIRYKLGGVDSDKRGYIPDLSKGLTGFRAHLQALGMILRIQLHGGLFQQDLDILEELSGSQDKNSLYQALHLGFKDTVSDSQVENLMSTLLDDSLFPSDRLPQSSDRCEAYLWQRDQGTDDWEPCPEEGVTHAPVDFLFVSALLLGDFSI